MILKELDDRGLLDGGGVVPSYYRSLKQKQRRYLELQRRSSRLKQRGQDVSLFLTLHSRNVYTLFMRICCRMIVRVIHWRVLFACCEY